MQTLWKQTNDFLVEHLGEVQICHILYVTYYMHILYVQVLRYNRSKQGAKARNAIRFDPSPETSSKFYDFTITVLTGSYFIRYICIK